MFTTLKKLIGDDLKGRRSVRQAIEAATLRGSTLTKQLLTFARRQRILNPETIDVRASASISFTRCTGHRARRLGFVCGWR